MVIVACKLPMLHQQLAQHQHRYFVTVACKLPMQMGGKGKGKRQGLNEDH